MTEFDPTVITYRVKDLVKATGLSKSTIWNLIYSGELPSFKFHGSRLVMRADVEAMFKKAQSQQAQQGPTAQDQGFPLAQAA